MAVTRRLKDANDVSELAIATTQLTGGSNGDFLVRQAGDWSGANAEFIRDTYRGITYHQMQVACTAVDGALPRTDDWEEVFRFVGPGYPGSARMRPPLSSNYIWAYVATTADELIEVDVRVDNTSIFTSGNTLKIQSWTQFDDASQLYVDGSNTLLADSISVHVRLNSGATGGAGLIIGFHYYIP
jgi:hypothetical protein